METKNEIRRLLDHCCGGGFAISDRAARMISAAPELAEALAACNLDDHHDVNCGVYTGTISDCDCWVSKARAALAKAGL